MGEFIGIDLRNEFARLIPGGLNRGKIAFERSQEQLMKSRYLMFAGYNAWCNERLYDAAAKLSDADYRADRGAFFKSLHGTLNHLLVGDRIWMQRFTGQGEVPKSLDAILYDDFAALRAARRAEDARISRYIEGLERRRSQPHDPLSHLRQSADHRAGAGARARSFLQSPDPPPRPGAWPA